MGDSFLGVLAIIWVIMIREKDIPSLESGEEDQKEVEKGIYLNLWRRHDIKMLCIIFVMDFFCYSYLAVILPSYLSEMGNLPEATAGFWAAIAFPAFGILGGIIGGITTAKLGRRKPTLGAGQVLKFAGILIASLGSSISVYVTILGIAIFGLGNSMWMPVLYSVPMELEGMTPTRVGAAFAFISSCGFLVGFISPVFGGWLTNLFMSLSSITDPSANHAFGLKWSLFAFGFVNIISFICALLMNETGPAARKNR